MKLFLSAALVACLLAVDGCQSATVRGTQGRSLTATAPVSMTIRRGASAPLSIDIDRERFTGAVTVSIFQLPKGVEPDKSSIKAETTTATFFSPRAVSARQSRKW